MKSLSLSLSLFLSLFLLLILFLSLLIPFLSLLIPFLFLFLFLSLSLSNYLVSVAANLNLVPILHSSKALMMNVKRFTEKKELFVSFKKNHIFKMHFFCSNQNISQIYNIILIFINLLIKKV